MVVHKHEAAVILAAVDVMICNLKLDGICDSCLNRSTQFPNNLQCTKQC